MRDVYLSCCLMYVYITQEKKGGEVEKVKVEEAGDRDEEEEDEEEETTTAVAAGEKDVSMRSISISSEMEQIEQTG